MNHAQVEKGGAEGGRPKRCDCPQAGIPGKNAILDAQRAQIANRASRAEKHTAIGHWQHSNGVIRRIDAQGAMTRQFTPG